jgi:hypothetical protein
MEFETPKLKKKTYEGKSLDIVLFSNAELDEQQVGYSIGKCGELLFGFEEGDWQEGWLVIGYETGCGDPIFIDLNEPGVPVYTAAHGMGSWSEVEIASSYAEFLEILDERRQANNAGVWEFFFG